MKRCSCFDALLLFSLLIMLELVTCCVGYGILSPSHNFAVFMARNYQSRFVRMRNILADMRTRLLPFVCNCFARCATVKKQHTSMRLLISDSFALSTTRQIRMCMGNAHQRRIFMFGALHRKSFPVPAEYTSA